jgi:PIN domain nuclease of toxin-antitoxin system
MGCTVVIILDTHVLVWLDAGSPRLSKPLVETIDQALSKGELAISTMSFWEIGMLIEKGRLQLAMPLALWRSELLRKGLTELPVSGDIAMRAAQLDGFHGDPMDRLIVSSALVHSASLCTADQKILQWQGSLTLLAID